MRSIREIQVGDEIKAIATGFIYIVEKKYNTYIKVSIGNNHYNVSMDKLEITFGIKPQLSHNDTS